MPTVRFGKKADFEFHSDIRLQGVESVLEHINEFVPHARDQAILRKEHELLASDTDDHELIEAELDVLKDDWSSRLPSYFLGSVAVLLWADVEILINRFADEVRTERGTMLAFDDIARPSPSSRRRKYVQAVLGQTLKDDGLLEDIYFLRNLVAHHNGDTSAQSDSRKKRVDAIIRSNPGLRLVNGFLLLDATYLQAAIAATRQLFDTLGSLHPSGEPPLVEIEP
jgi:hypothetical protein